MSHLTPELLIQAYINGAFPMAEGPGRTQVNFYISDPRALIPLDHRFHIRRSLAKALRRNLYRLSADQDFDTVIQRCASMPREGAWLTPSIMEGFCLLHRMGLAHCVEARMDGQLVGGVYGLALGGVFFGESMFSEQPYASQFALVELVRRLREQGFVYFDAQISNPHTQQFGLYETDFSAWHPKMLTAIAQWTPWGQSWTTPSTANGMSSNP